MNYLKTLENESIDIIRNTFAQAENPVMSYRLGKTECVTMTSKESILSSGFTFPINAY